MEMLLFMLPSLLVAAAYLAPVTGGREEVTRLPGFEPGFDSFCGCKR